jgi:hypothetical protein
VLLNIQPSCPPCDRVAPGGHERSGATTVAVGRRRCRKRPDQPLLGYVSLVGALPRHPLGHTAAAHVEAVWERSALPRSRGTVELLGDPVGGRGSHMLADQARCLLTKVLGYPLRLAEYLVHATGAVLAARSRRLPAC